MAGISDFISKATKDLGIPAGAARAGAGGLLDLVRSEAGADTFAKVTQALPDAAQVAKPPSGPAPAPSGGGGLLGGLAEKAGGLLGGAGGAGGLVGLLAKAGISPDKVPAFAASFVGFLKSKLSPDLMKTILSKVGALKGLAGS